MSDNVIRQDVIQISFDTDMKVLSEILDQLDDIKKKVNGTGESDGLDKVKKQADEANKASKNLKETLGDVGSKLGEVAKKAAGFTLKTTAKGIGVCAAAVGTLAVNAVSAYGEFEQLKGGVETLFGAKGAKSVEEYAKYVGKDVSEVKDKYKELLAVEDTVIKHANDAYKTAGLSANDYMSTVTSFSASLIQSLDGDTKKAADLANKAIVDMSDNANKMGTDMGSIQYAYQGFAKQNYTMLDNLKLGYGGTKSEMERLLKDAGKLANTKFDISSYADVIEAIHVIQDNMGITGTTAKEANFTIQGSMNAMKAAWGNLMPALIKGGDEFDQCVDNLIESIVGVEDESGNMVGGVINNIMPALEKGLDGIGTLIEKIGPIIEKHLPGLIDRLLPPLIRAGTSLFIGLVKALPNIVKIIIKELPNIARLLGEGIRDAFGDNSFVKTAFEKLESFFSWLSENIGTVKKVAIGAGAAIAGIFIAVKGFKLFKAISSIFSAAGDTEKDTKKGTGFFEKLAKMSPKTVLKGIANLAIIIGGLTLIAAVLMAVAPGMAALSDFKSILKVLAVIGLLALVGAGLAKLAEKIGKINVGTVSKGLANMAIMLVGMGAVAAVFLWLTPYIAALGDFKSILKVAAVMVVLGVVGTALSAFAGIAGAIPFSTVLLGLANMAIVLVGFGALAAAFLWLSPYMAALGDFKDILKVAAIMTLLGVVGTALSVLAGIVGVIPFPLVIAGLANIATVILGMEAILVAFGALASIPGFTGFIEKGGELLAVTFKAIGKAVGSLIAGLAEGVTSALPAIGKNFAGFAKELSGTDFTPISGFFDALSSVSGVPSAGGVLGFFTGDPYNGLLKMAFILPMLGTAVAAFLTNVGGTTNFDSLSALLNALSNVSGMPSAGGFFQFFTGDPYKGLQSMIELLPGLGTSVGQFFANVGGITDFTGLSSLFNSLSSIGELPKAGGFAQFFLGDPYKGLAMLILELPAIGTAVGQFFANVGEITDFSAISTLFNTLASVKELPKAGGFAQFFTGSPYAALAALILELPAIGTAVSSFFTNLGEITDFSLITSLMNELASVKELPKAGGFAQFFTGSAYTALGSMVLLLPGLGEAVKKFFGAIDGIADFGRITELFNVLGGLEGAVGKDGGLFGAIGELFNGSEESTVHKLGVTLKTFGENTKDFFASVSNLDINNLNALWYSLENAGELTSTNLSKVLDESIKTLVKKATDLPVQMADGIKSTGASLAKAIVSIWETAVKAAISPVNKLISGANWVMKQFGSDKTVTPWTPYARGTDGHRGGNALVNDGRGAELVQMPNGYTFIPRGRNVLLPNAPQGMKVLDATKTAKLLGKSAPTFRYEKGTGDFDVFSHETGKSLANAISKNFVNYDGMSGYALSLGKAMVATVKGEMAGWGDKLIEEFGAKGLGDYVASAGVEQWRSTVIRALRMEGQYSAANVKRTLYQMQTESGGNPRAINLWDSNAKKGIPSKGLMQVIDPTFNAYARDGFNKNIYDPLSNILASVRYATSRYGSLAKAYQGHGYANGVGTVTLPQYTPSGSVTASSKSETEYNSYAPVFNLTISGATDERTLASKVKRWVAEAMEECFEGMARRNA